jgi:hypothetical protein
MEEIQSPTNRRGGSSTSNERALGRKLSALGRSSSELQAEARATIRKVSSLIMGKGKTDEDTDSEDGDQVVRKFRPHTRAEAFDSRNPHIVKRCFLFFLTFCFSNEIF